MSKHKIVPDHTFEIPKTDGLCVQQESPQVFIFFDEIIPKWVTIEGTILRYGTTSQELIFLGQVFRLTEEERGKNDPEVLDHFINIIYEHGFFQNPESVFILLTSDKKFIKDSKFEEKKDALRKNPPTDEADKIKSGILERIHLLITDRPHFTNKHFRQSKQHREQFLQKAAEVLNDFYESLFDESR